MLVAEGIIFSWSLIDTTMQDGGKRERSVVKIVDGRLYFYFSLFILFYFSFFFFFYFLEQLGLGFISYAVTSVTT